MANNARSIPRRVRFSDLCRASAIVIVLQSFVAEGRIGVVHGFIKKTRKTPPADIALAQKRMKDMT